MERLFKRKELDSHICTLCKICIEDINHAMTCINDSGKINKETIEGIHRYIMKLTNKNKTLSLAFQWPLAQMSQNEDRTEIMQTPTEKQIKDIKTTNLCVIPKNMRKIIKKQYEIYNESVITKILKYILKKIIETRHII